MTWKCDAEVREGAAGCDRGGCSRRTFLLGAACAAGALAFPGAMDAAGAPMAVTFVEGVQSGTDRTYEIPATDGVLVDREAQVMLSRVGGHVMALSLVCPHENAAVRWLRVDQRFQCSRHESKYQPDGVFREGRATRNMDRYPIRKDGSTLHVDISRVFQSDRDPEGWAAAAVAV